MSSFTINIAYTIENDQVAKDIAAKLSPVNIEFNLIGSQWLVDEKSFQERIIEEENPCLLLVSDNFLKSVACMNNALVSLQSLVKKELVIPIIIDGVYQDEEGGQKTVITQFERVSNVIKYMNYWQERYLELRKLKRSVPASEEEDFGEKLKKVRAISSEVGEFLRYLRETNYYTEEEFRANHFEAFFRNFGDEASYLKFVGLSQSSEESNNLISNEPEEEVVISEEPAEVVPENNAEEETITKEELVESNVFESPPEVIYDEPSDEVVDEIEMNEKDQEIVDLVNDQEIEDYILDEEEVSLEEAAQQEDRELTDTELLAIELAQKLPNKSSLITNQLTEEKEEIIEEEMISLEDLMGADLMASTKEEEITNEADTSSFENEFGEDPELDLMEVEALTGEKGININLDLCHSDQEGKEAIISDEILNEADEIEESGVDEEEELEGYVVDEEEDEFDESEVELTEFDVLQAANILAQSGKVTESISLLESALKEAPEFNSVRYQYAAFLAQYQNDFREAANQLAELLENDPSNLSAKFFLGELAEAERDYLSAKSYFEKVYEENPVFPNVQYKLGLLLINHLKGPPEKAAQYFEQACELNPNNVNALYQLGVLQSEILESENSAIQSFEQVLSKAPEHPFANYDLALLFFNKGEEKKALSYYDTACIINPELKTLENDQAFLDTFEVEGVEENAIEDLNAEINEKMELHLSHSGDATNIASPVLAVVEEVEWPTVPPEVQEDEVTQYAPKPFPLNEGPQKTVLITGATSGIGKATAELFARNGYKLILTGRRFSRLFKLKESFENDFGVDVKLLPFDVRIAADVQSALEELSDDWRQIDILINNAGLAKGFEPIHEGKLEDWETMIDTNIKGLLYMTRAIAPFMVKRKKGHIINICSIAGKEVYPNGGVYCATKHAVDALTKAMRIDLHKYNIRVSQVAPGHVEETEFSLVRYDGDEESAKKVYEGFIPINSSDVADVIYFMANRPPHVNIQDVLMMGSQQASATITDKSGR